MGIGFDAFTDVNTLRPADVSVALMGEALVSTPYEGGLRPWSTPGYTYQEISRTLKVDS